MKNSDHNKLTEKIEGSSILIYGSSWCGDCLRAKRLLDNHEINYIWIDVSKDEQARAFVIKTNKGYCSIPTIVFEDGSILVEPNNKELTEKLGL